MCPKIRPRLAATEIMQDFQRIKQAVDRVRVVNGCAVEQISFASSMLAMGNPSAPADRRCHIFYPEGGGVSRVKFNIQYFDPAKFTSGTLWYTFSMNIYNYFIGFNASNRQLNLGTHNNGVASVDLLANIYGVTNNVCRAYNRLVGYNGPTYNPPTINIYGNMHYSGVFQDGTSYQLPVPTGCTYNSTYDANFITFPLVER